MPWQLAFAHQPLRRTIHHVVQQGKIIIDVYRPVRNPEACKMDASVAAVDPLPFVPAINTLENRRSGFSSAASSTRMCPKSNLCDGV
jgi:hypothetical protein